MLQNRIDKLLQANELCCYYLHYLLFWLVCLFYTDMLVRRFPDAQTCLFFISFLIVNIKRKQFFFFYNMTSHLLLDCPLFLSKYFSTFILPSIILFIVGGSWVLSLSFILYSLFWGRLREQIIQLYMNISLHNRLISDMLALAYPKLYVA